MHTKKIAENIRAFAEQYNSNRPDIQSSYYTWLNEIANELDPPAPKPLLADAKVGDLCQRRDGKYVLIESVSYDRPCQIMCKSDIGGQDCFTLDGRNHNAVNDSKDIIITEPLAAEGSAEWAWQMAKLGIETKCSRGKIRISKSGMIEVCYGGMAYAMPMTQSPENRQYVINKMRKCSPDGWQLYGPKPEPEPKPEHPAINGYNRYDYIPVEGIRQPKPEPRELTMKFETINGQLCIMLEKPDAINEFSKTPCVIACKCGGLKKYYILDFPPSNPSMSMLAEGFEIIGYPVVEGSKEWAFYQHKQGLAISNPKHGLFRHTFSSDNNTWDCISVYPDGWIIEPKPMFADAKVGDWVEYSDGTLQQAIIEAYSGQPGEQMVYVWHPQTAHSAKAAKRSIVRKLDPSEVIVNIGCLEGTVAPGCSDTTIMIVPIGYNGFGDVAIIPVAMLDSDTADLVKALLKAQEEK